MARSLLILGIITLFMCAVPLRAEEQIKDNLTGEYLRSTGKVQEALEWFQKELKKDENNPQLLIGLGWCYLDKGENEAAVNCFERAQAQGVTNAKLYEGLSWAFLMRGNPQKTVEYCKQAIAQHFGDSNFWRICAIGYWNLEKWDIAEDYLKKAIAIDPNEAENYRTLGRLYQYLGRNEEAMHLFQCSVELGEHNYACPYEGLGKVYKALGNAEKAEENFRTEINRSPSDYRGYYDMARYYLDIGALDESAHYLEKAKEYMVSDKKQKVAVLILDVFYMILREDYDEAEHALRSIVTEYGETAPVLTAYGHIYNAKKNYAKAEGTFLKSLNEADDYSWGSSWRALARIGLGWVYANQNRHEDAISQYELVLKKEPLQVLALLGAGNAYNWLGQYEEAESYFSRVLALNDNNEYALAELGTVYLNKGDYSRAFELLEKAKEINNTEYSCPFEGLGLWYLKKGNNDKAEEYFQKAIDINPYVEYRKYNGLARIYIQQGKLAKARTLLLQSIENYPYDQEAQEILSHLEKLEHVTKGKK